MWVIHYHHHSHHIKTDKCHTRRNKSFCSANMLDGFTRIHSANSHISQEKCTLRHKYFRYLHKSDPIMFTILSATKRAEVHLARTIVSNVILLGYVSCSSAGARCWQCLSSSIVPHQINLVLLSWYLLVKIAYMFVSFIFHQT